MQAQKLSANGARPLPTRGRAPKKLRTSVRGVRCCCGPRWRRRGWRALARDDVVAAAILAVAQADRRRIPFDVPAARLLAV